MLCEQCQSNEATVHFSAVAWPSGEVTKHLCETCYPKDEAERTHWYGLRPNPLPVIDPQEIAARKYWDRERLAREILTKALETLEKGDDAWELVGFGCGLGSSVTGVKSAELIELLEKIFLRLFELMAESATPPADHPFGVGLTMAGNALRRADPARFSTLLEGLKAKHKGSIPAHAAVLDYLERRESEKWGGRKRGTGH